LPIGMMMCSAYEVVTSFAAAVYFAERCGGEDRKLWKDGLNYFNEIYFKSSTDSVNCTLICVII